MDLGAIVGHSRTKSKICDDVRTGLKTESKAEKLSTDILESLIKESVDDAVASISMGISTWAVNSDTFVDAQNMVLKRANQNARAKLSTVELEHEPYKVPERAFVEQEQMNQILGSREPHMLKTLQENAMNAKDDELDYASMRQWAPKKRAQDE